MNTTTYNPFQLREIFHLEFLRWLSKKVKPSSYALKGGVNLRFFYNSFRYSEDIDLNIRFVHVHTLQDKVMNMLTSPSFYTTLKPFGIDEIIPPDISKAKQTQITQRFKVHLITPRGEDFFTKIEFSRRKFKNNIKVETVSSTLLRQYKLAPLLVPHYDIISAISQKVDALANRKIIQARDAFDIYILSTQWDPLYNKKTTISPKQIQSAHENIFEISFGQFKDTVIPYLLDEDQKIYNAPHSWDDIKLKTAHFIQELKT